MDHRTQRCMFLLLFSIYVTAVLGSAPDHSMHNHNSQMDHSMHRHNMTNDKDMDMPKDKDMPMPMPMPGMKMYFHFGVEETVLFEAWKIRSVGGMIGSVIGIFMLGMLYEGLKYFREYLFKQYISNIQFSTVAITSANGAVSQVHKVEKHKMLSNAHGIQTVLHIIQIIFSYFLMLIVMTYNVWLCLAVTLGAGVGYFIFGWKKASVVDITEHCH